MHNILDDENLKQKKSPEDVRFATFWTRVGASLIDSLIMIPLIVGGVFNMMDFKNLPLYLLLQVAALLYKPWMEGNYGATLGKMAVKIKVVTTDFQDINLQQSLNRYVFYFANSFMGLAGGFLLFIHKDFSETSDFYELAELQAKIGMPEIEQFLSLLVFVSCIFCTFDPLKQTLHDKVAKTYVIHTEG